MWAMTRLWKEGTNENKRNTTQIALQQLPTVVGGSATLHFRGSRASSLTNPTHLRFQKVAAFKPGFVATGFPLLD
jgi:hypothetical protein